MSSQRLPFTTTDVFTNTRYEGNPLAIVLMPPSQPLSQSQKQLIAREFNFSETVILHSDPASDQARQWTFDIFLTDAEIPFAGHPTIGTIVYLGRKLATTTQGIVEGTLLAKAGRLPFTYDPASGVASAGIPHDSHVHQGTFDAGYLEELGASREVVGGVTGAAVVVSIVKGMTFGLVELASLEALGGVAKGYQQFDTQGLTEEYVGKGPVGLLFYHVVETGEAVTKVRTRMVLGAIEDPATGSASSALAVWLATGRFQAAGARVHRFEMTQGVEMGRRSVIGVDVGLDERGAVEQVTLRGTAVEVTEGFLQIP